MAEKKKGLTMKERFAKHNERRKSDSKVEEDSKFTPEQQRAYSAGYIKRAAEESAIFKLKEAKKQ